MVSEPSPHSKKVLTKQADENLDLTPPRPRLLHSGCRRGWLVCSFHFDLFFHFLYLFCASCGSVQFGSLFFFWCVLHADELLCTRLTPRHLSTKHLFLIYSQWICEKTPFVKTWVRGLSKSSRFIDLRPCRFLPEKNTSSFPRYRVLQDTVHSHITSFLKFLFQHHPPVPAPCLCVCP